MSIFLLYLQLDYIGTKSIYQNKGFDFYFGHSWAVQVETKNTARDGKSLTQGGAAASRQTVDFSLRKRSMLL